VAYNLDGSWDVQNHGVSPDYEVEMNPKLVREGHDPQLEKAVEVVLAQLKKDPVNYGTRRSLTLATEANRGVF
jgi:tricorn protease